MSDLVPAPAGPTPSILAPLTNPGGGSTFTRLRSFVAQPAVKKTLPWFAGMMVLGAGTLSWGMLAPVPQRVLYTQLDDAERASVVEALEKGAIHYTIDNATGALTVNESELYKARMLVAQNGALALPDTSSDGLDKLPMGASRALEGERLRAAKEHELTLSIKEIDAVQSVRVHIAEGEKSVFVRDSVAPTASVMLRLANGRQLSASQVAAIVNLVAGSVPGLTPDAVKVVDQHGRLLTEKTSADNDRIELQARLEDKLQGQVSTLLAPMLGDGNFTAEIQVDLDMDQQTTARESYDKQGVIRTETQAQSQTPGTGAAVGIPGATSNTPPPAATPVATAPGATPAPAPAPGTTGESSATRTYELGREVAVSNRSPGKIRRLSVAVALSQSAMAKAKPADIDQIKQLVSAAVGADPARGDQVAVFVRSFDTPAEIKVPFYEAPWFADVLHHGVLLVGVLLVLLLGVRPLIKALKPDPVPPLPAPSAEGEDAQTTLAEGEANDPAKPGTDAEPESAPLDAAALGRHVDLAQQIAAQKPDSAVIALRQMLQPPAGEE